MTTENTAAVETVGSVPDFTTAASAVEEKPKATKKKKDENVVTITKDQLAEMLVAASQRAVEQALANLPARGPGRPAKVKAEPKVDLRKVRANDWKSKVEALGQDPAVVAKACQTFASPENANGVVAFKNAYNAKCEELGVPARY